MASHHLQKRITVESPAKLNLHLEVLSKREDGYHEIETILQTISLFDKVEIGYTPLDHGEKSTFVVDVDPVGAAPADDSNLCVAAAKLISKRSAKPGRFSFMLQKSIPSEAGLGGGSSNAAAVLVGLNRLLACGYSDRDLEAMGAELGADVPFFIKGGTQLARGIGTDLTPLNGLRSGFFLLVKPAVSVQTADAYQQLNMGLTSRSAKVNIRRVEALLARFPLGSWFGINRLEEGVMPSQPLLQRILIDLQERSSFAMMTGSGATIFAICENRQEGEELADGLAENNWFVRVVEPCGVGVRITEG
jgi:4-diphosphocytidyl-2-C-methyl-D-erythritol kinase